MKLQITLKENIHPSTYISIKLCGIDTLWRNCYILVSGSMLQEKLIAKQLEISDLVASSGWLEKFK